MNLNLLSSTTLTGTDVVNGRGDNLGNLKDLMINTRSGKIEYAVLSFGGFLGMGDKLFAVPWQAFGLDKADEELVLDVDKETLENSPGFDKDDWPTSASHEYLTDVYRHYDYSPFWER